MAAEDPAAPVRRSRASSRARAFWRRIFVWHQRIGLAAAVLVAILAVTGVLLNHTERLRLDERYATQGWLLDWYGVAPSGEPVGYRAGERWLTWLEGGLLLDGEPVAADVAKLVGALALDGLLVAAAADELILLTPEGDVVERVAATGLPGRIAEIGRNEAGRVVIATDSGTFVADEALLGWEPTADSPAAAAVEPLPDEIEAETLAAYRGRGLPWERVILDLHSGRILGAWGPWLMDAAAVCLLFLAGTGFYNWLRLRRGRRR